MQARSKTGQSSYSQHAQYADISGEYLKTPGKKVIERDDKYVSVLCVFYSLVDDVFLKNPSLMEKDFWCYN